MAVNNTLIYSEVYSILDLLGPSYISKLPKDTYDKILEQKSDKLVQKLTSFSDITIQNIHKESVAMIAYFHLNYWSNMQEKEYLEKIFAMNFAKNEEEKRKKYNPDDIFKKVSHEPVKVEEALQVQKESFFRKLINKIKNILGM